MDQAFGPKNVEVIHKEKEAKRKTEVQQPIANRPIGNSTIGRVSHVSSPISTEVVHTIQATDQKQQTIDQSALARAESRAKSIKTLEIDDYLLGLIMEGLLDEQFLPYAAKVCYAIGLPHVNRLVINVRSTVCDKPGQSRMKLLAWKMNGALQLHHKKLFYGEHPGSVSPELPRQQ